MSARLKWQVRMLAALALASCGGAFWSDAHGWLLLFAWSLWIAASVVAPWPPPPKVAPPVVIHRRPGETSQQFADRLLAAVIRDMTR